jgi:hypothetical protein
MKKLLFMVLIFLGMNGVFAQGFEALSPPIYIAVSKLDAIKPLNDDMQATYFYVVANDTCYLGRFVIYKGIEHFAALQIHEDYVCRNKGMFSEEDEVMQEQGDGSGEEVEVSDILDEEELPEAEAGYIQRILEQKR